MASKALICSASPLVSNKAGSGPLAVGISPSSVVFPSPKMGRSLVVKALDQPGNDTLHVPDWRHSPALLDSPRYVRAPWRHTENDNEIVVSFDMPGVLAEDIEVKIIENLLIIDVLGGERDASGRKVVNYDTKVHLPFNCLRKDAQALLRNGVLYISLPKIYIDHTAPIIVPVKSA